MIDRDPVPPSTGPACGSILVIAPPDRAEHVVRALEGLAAAGRPVGTVHEAMARLTADTIAIVAAPEGAASDPSRSNTQPALEASPESLLEALGSDGRTAALPVLVVVDDGFDDERARRLHTAGAAAVLAWPSEVRLLPGLVLELSDRSLAARRREPEDAALGDAVEARIGVDATPASELRCRVVDGTAILRGETDSPWRAHRLAELVANVPGIEHVDARELHVIPPVVPDEELDRTVRDVIRSAMGDASTGVEVTTCAGEVTLAGTLVSEAARRRLEGVVENVPGVTGLDDRITVLHDEASA
jgi:osmotically-inducible protein OsmY